MNLDNIVVNRPKLSLFTKASAQAPQAIRHAEVAKPLPGTLSHIELRRIVSEMLG